MELDSEIEKEIFNRSLTISSISEKVYCLISSLFLSSILIHFSRLYFNCFYIRVCLYFIALKIIRNY